MIFTTQLHYSNFALVFMDYSANPIFLQIISERYDCSMTRQIVSYRKFPSLGKLIQDPRKEIHNEIHEKIDRFYSTGSKLPCDLLH